MGAQGSADLRKERVEPGPSGEATAQMVDNRLIQRISDPDKNDDNCPTVSEPQLGDLTERMDDASSSSGKVSKGEKKKPMDNNSR